MSCNTVSCLLCLVSHLSCFYCLSHVTHVSCLSCFYCLSCVSRVSCLSSLVSLVSLMSLVSLVSLILSHIIHCIIYYLSWFRGAHPGSKCISILCFKILSDGHIWCAVFLRKFRTFVCVCISPNGLDILVGVKFVFS